MKKADEGLLVDINEPTSAFKRELGYNNGCPSDMRNAILDTMRHFNTVLKHSSERPSSEQLILDFYAILHANGIDFQTLK